MDRYDVVVLGTGAAGLTAAVTAHDGGARVAVFEKAAQVGGTSAWSGGHVWIPNNPHMAAVGAEDSPEEALTYLMSLSRGTIEERLARAYIEAGPEMVGYLDAKAGTEFYAVRDFPDYHPEHPGGKPGGGRTVECPLFPFADLGEWAERVTPSPYFATLNVTMSETPLGAARPSMPSPEEMAADPRRAGPRPGPGRPAAQGRPGPGHRTGDRGPGPPAPDGRGPGRRSGHRDGVGSERGPGRPGGDPRHRRLRVERRVQAGLPARPVDPPGVD